MGWGLKRKQCYWKVPSIVLATVFLLSTSADTRADIAINLDLVHGYSIYYPTLSITATNPVPITYHRVESPSGLIWRQTDSGNGPPSMSPTNDLSGLINECTNGLWTLILNVGDPSESNYTFSVVADGISTNLFGDITVTHPAANSTITTNLPDFQWTSTSLLPDVRVSAYDTPRTVTIGAMLPGTATNWIPYTALAEGENRFYSRYSSNDYTGVVFSVPTNLVGGQSLSGWSATADLRTYAIQMYTITSPPPAIQYGAIFSLELQRNIISGLETYKLFPRLYNPVPTAITFHEVISPSGLCSGTEADSTSTEFLTLDDVIAECVGGNWTMVFDKNSPSNKVYHFTVELDGINTNTLQQVVILSPEDGSTEHFGNPLMSWTGPTNFNPSTASIHNWELQVPSTFAFLAPTDTTWPDAPALAQGANRLSVSYTYGSHPGFTISRPINDLGETVNIWSSSGQLTTTASSTFHVKTGSPPYDVLSTGLNDGDFSLMLTPRLFPEFSYTLRCSTNLAEGSWEPIASFSGTGAPLRFTPATTNPAAYYRIDIDL